MDDYKERRKAFDQDFPNILATISGGSNIDIVQLEIESSKVEDLLDEAITNIERKNLFISLEKKYCFLKFHGQHN